MAFLLEDRGEQKFIKWASTLLTEWVDASAVSLPTEGRASRRSRTANRSPMVDETPSPSPKARRKLGGSSRKKPKVDYTEKEEGMDEDEFEWNPDENEEEEEFNTTPLRSRKQDKKKKGRGRKSGKEKEPSDLDDVASLPSVQDRSSKKRKKKRCRESDISSRYQSDHESVEEQKMLAKKKARRDGPEKAALREEESISESKSTATLPNSPGPTRTPNKNTRDYPVDLDDIVVGSFVAKVGDCIYLKILHVCLLPFSTTKQIQSCVLRLS